MVRPLVPRLVAAGCRVVHLSGSNDPELGSLQLPGYAERPFSDELPGLLQHADLAISRAGAGSLSELAVCGTPALLVPFPQAADAHQDANAAAAVAVGAAVLLRQRAADDPTLERTLRALLGPRLGRSEGSSDPLLGLRAGMGRLAEREADRRLAQLLVELSAA